MSATTDRTPESVLDEADELARGGSALGALDLLRSVDEGGRTVAIERRLAELRYRAFGELEPGGFGQWPVPVEGVDRGGPACIPEIGLAELSAERLRREIQSRGSLLVRGLFAGESARFVDGIDETFAVQVQGQGGPKDTSWFHPLSLPKDDARLLGRYWVTGAGGVLACDSPRLLQMLFEAYEALGLREVVTEYLGERPVLSANKATLRRVPLTSNTDWHQDGAFLGEGIRALNLWVALSECGVDSPGMDLVPKRFDAVVETGTGGAYFDWSVGPETVEVVAADAPPVRPHFQAGDVLFFDDLFLHRTAIDASMTRPRYAIESWFFAPTGYPNKQVPLVW